MSINDGIIKGKSI